MMNKFTIYNSQFTNKKQLGFTLIELLVVISIIGILAALVTVSFTSSQRQARDVQRKSDLRQYQTALESDANKNGGLYVSEVGSGSGADLAVTVCEDLSLTTCPEDPKNTTDSTFQYKYISDGAGSGASVATKYVLWAKLENATDYWVVCSIGKNGIKSQTGWSNPSAGTCPL